jgi:ribosomal protein S18 acetylase RimI-like enzyme
MFTWFCLLTGGPRTVTQILSHYTTFLKNCKAGFLQERLQGPGRNGILRMVMMMQNIPVFMSQGGTATLILREIPFRGTAFVLLRTVLNLELLLEDAIKFCRECGAKRCFVSAGETDCRLEGRSHYDIYILHARKATLPEPVEPVELVPVTEENGEKFLEIYNRCFNQVSHALTYDRGQLQRIFHTTGQQAFLAQELDGNAWGMGELHGNELAAVGLLPENRGQGRSRDLTLSLLSRCPGPEITLTVVSDNTPALRLYDRLGFRVRQVESSWYEI